MSMLEITCLSSLVFLLLLLVFWDQRISKKSLQKARWDGRPFETAPVSKRISCLRRHFTTFIRPRIDPFRCSKFLFQARRAINQRSYLRKLRARDTTEIYDH